MRSCKEISELISESLDRRLPLGQRIAVRMHLLMCKLCFEFSRQLRFMKKSAQRYIEEIEPSDALSPISLSPEARKRIADAISGEGERIKK
jgi:hypothetical protein